MRLARISHVLNWSVAALVIAAPLKAGTGKLLLAEPKPFSSPSTQAKTASDPFNSLFEQATAAQHAKEYNQALALFQKALSIADIHSRPMSWLTAEFNICHTLSLQGKRDRAAEVARLIVSECEKAFGSDDPLTSEALNHLAFILKKQGRLDEAEPVYHRNVQILEEKYGSDHYLVAHAVCRHGSLLLSLGRSLEAETQLRRALAIVVKTTDPQAGEQADLCYYVTHLAYCLHSGQKADEARQLMDMAYSIVQKETSVLHTSHAGSILRRQAEYYRDVHQLDRAENLGHQCLLLLSRRRDVDRMKFYYYDTAEEVYRSILRAQGMNSQQIENAVQKVHDEATAPPTTAAAPNALGVPASN